MNKERKSNIELLRIFSIFLIICFHYVYYSEYSYTNLDLQSYIIKCILFCGELGCNLFLLITGYFYDKNKLTFKKVLKLILEVYFYYYISLFISFRLDLVDIHNTNELIKLFFPLTNPLIYWFVTAYFLLLLFVPYLNTTINNIDKSMHKQLIITSLIVWSIIPTVYGILFNYSEKGFFFNRFIWAVILYFIGSYIRKYNFNFINTNKKLIRTFIITSSIMIFSIYFFDKNYDFFNSIGTNEVAYLWTPNNIFMIILSICVFNMFLKINIKSKIINIISSTTLGIYLIHDGPLSKLIWDTLFKTKYYINSDYPIINILFASFTILIICVLIDLIRQSLEDITINKLLYKKKKKS
ncbi:MAG: acyltransferase family protein [bacterium]|nr:acyltransferase family protein [bacterium]